MDLAHKRPPISREEGSQLAAEASKLRPGHFCPTPDSPIGQGSLCLEQAERLREQGASHAGSVPFPPNRRQSCRAGEGSLCPVLLHPLYLHTCSPINPLHSRYHLPVAIRGPEWTHHARAGPWPVPSALGKPEAGAGRGPGKVCGREWKLNPSQSPWGSLFPCRSHLQLRLLLQGLGDHPGCFHAHCVAFQAQSL